MWLSGSRPSVLGAVRLQIRSNISGVGLASTVIPSGRTWQCTPQSCVRLFGAHRFILHVEWVFRHAGVHPLCHKCPAAALSMAGS